MDRFQIGYDALLKHKDVKQIALVNHKDNFHLALSGFVWDTIVGSFVLSSVMDTEEVKEFNKLCNDATYHERGRSYKGIIGPDYTTVMPSRSPLVRQICDKVYDEIHTQENSPSSFP